MRFVCLVLPSVLLFFSPSYESRAQTFFYNPVQPSVPQLILITGCTGTGKSTFGMSVALSQGILRCLSTDSIRQVLRSTSSKESNPALYRSSFEGDGDAVTQWIETCKAVEYALSDIIDDAINRGNSIVIEGVGIAPSNLILDKWRSRGGVAMGCVMNIQSSADHQSLLYRRGEMTKKGEQKKIGYFARIRTIQEEMVRLGLLHDWLIVEQKVEPAPIEVISEILKSSSSVGDTFSSGACVSSLPPKLH